MGERAYNRTNEQRHNRVNLNFVIILHLEMAYVNSAVQILSAYARCLTPALPLLTVHRNGVTVVSNVIKCIHKKPSLTSSDL
jgi:hypothetical protein